MRLSLLLLATLCASSLFTLQMNDLPMESPESPKPTKRQLILIRHAKASDGLPGQGDFNRPLEERGIHDAKAMGIYLDKKNISRERILYSPSVRTVQTMHLLFGENPSTNETRVMDSTVYLASPEDYLDAIEITPDSVNCLIIVGHNPSTTEIVNRLQRDKVYDEVPTCGVNAIQLNLDHWSDISTARGKLDFWMTPKKLEEINSK